MSAPETKAPFVVGVTGYMDIPALDRPVIEERLRTVFRWLRADPSPLGTGREPESDISRGKVWWPPGDPAGAVDGALPGGLGLGDHPITLLTSLAPGADTIAAQVALAEGIRVVAPLPFPAEMFRSSSSFCGERVEPGAQQQFDSLIANQDHPIDAFPVLLHTDQELDPITRDEAFRADLGDTERCNLRYRAAGEFVATHSHLLIALYNAGDDRSGGLETGAGTASIVHVRRSVPTVRIVPIPDDFPWIESGPVLHLRARSIKRIADPASIDSDTTWQDTPARLLPAYPDEGLSPAPATTPGHEDIAAACAELQEIAASLTGGAQA